MKDESPREPQVHYFTPSAPAPRAERHPVVFSMGERALTLESASGVFSARRVDPGTRLLARTAERALAAIGPAPRILDLGAGYGPLCVWLLTAAPGARAVATEVNPRAAALCAHNLKAHGLADRAEVRVGDGLAPVEGERFDLIVTNPPVRAGRAVYLPWLTGAGDLLSPGAELMWVQRTSQGAQTAARRVAEAYGAVSTRARGGGYRVLVASQPRSPSSSGGSAEASASRNGASDASGTRRRTTSATTDGG